MITIYPQEMTFTSIIEFLENDPTRLRGAQCDQLVPGSPFPLASPAPREPGYEATYRGAPAVISTIL